MPVFARRALVLAPIAMLALPDLVHAQSSSQDSVELPQITVRAPSPIVRRTPQRPAAGPAQGPAQAPAPLAVTVTPNAPLPGTLLATCRSSATSSRPSPWCRARRSRAVPARRSAIFCSASPASPDRVSRRADRAGRSCAGSTANRVGIVDNGIGSGGASDLGEDHFVPVDPLTSERIEVIRGPCDARATARSRSAAW